MVALLGFGVVAASVGALAGTMPASAPKATSPSARGAMPTPAGQGRSPAAGEALPTPAPLAYALDASANVVGSRGIIGSARIVEKSSGKVVSSPEFAATADADTRLVTVQGDLRFVLVLRALAGEKLAATLTVTRGEQVVETQRVTVPLREIRASTAQAGPPQVANTVLLGRLRQDPDSPLGLPLIVHVRQMPLGDLLAAIKALTGVDFVVGVDPAFGVDGEVDNVPLVEALRTLLTPYGVDVVADPPVVHVIRALRKPVR